MKAALFAALAVSAILLPIESGAQQQPASSSQVQSKDPLRPRDSTANLPSDSGSQTVIPGGAVTGAGQPQGTTRQPDVGSPGGLEPRARSDAQTANERCSSTVGSGSPEC